MPSDTPRASGDALERRVDLVLVQPVPELVHRPEQALEAVGEVARRDADVGHAGARRERVHRWVEAPRVGGEPELAHDLELEDLLGVDVERLLALLDLRPLGDLLDERRLVLLEVVEDAPHLGRLHAALVVVEHDVVRLVADLEAVDVALAQVEVLAEHGQERREVVFAARSDPDRVRERRRARHLRAQVRRHLARLLPVATRDADQARLERVVLVLLAEVAQVVQEPADISRDELRVRDAADASRAARHGSLRRRSASSPAGPS